MELLSRLFAPRRRKNRKEIAGRAAEVVVQVLFDVGVDRFLNGSIVLDKYFRIRFYSFPPLPQEAVASIALHELDEALALRDHLLDAGLDAAAVAHHARELTDAVMRALLERSPELRALSATRTARRASGVAA